MIGKLARLYHRSLSRIARVDGVHLETSRNPIGIRFLQSLPILRVRGVILLARRLIRYDPVIMVLVFHF